MDHAPLTDLYAAIQAHFSDATRLYALESEDLPAGLMVERWHGREGVSDGFEIQVDVLSTDVGLSLDAMLGQRVSLRTTLADGTRQRRTGLVAQARLLGGDGGLARYRLELRPWTWLLGHGRHSRVFQEQPLLAIIEHVFESYRPLAHWKLADELGPFLADRRPRSFCVQYRESDADFIARLLAEEGIGTRIEDDPEAPAGHTLVLFADSQQLPAAENPVIRFHQAASTETADAVQAIGARRQMGSTALTLLSHDYKPDRITLADLPLEQTIGAPLGKLERYDPAGAYAFAHADEAAHYARLHAQALEARQHTWVGHSSVRALRSGTGFTLTDAPGDTPPMDGPVARAQDAQERPPPELIVLAVEHAGINNLPDTLRKALDERLGFTQEAAGQGPHKKVLERAEQCGYGNRFVALNRDRPWRPVLADGTGKRLNPRPTAPGPQTAIVTGPDGSTTPQGHHAVHVDRLHRIRVRFHWQQHSDGANDSCWLRVAEGHAGPGGGSHFIPRIGQEVLVQFLGGDIDRPIVMGALYNGQGEAGTVPTPGGKAAQSDTAAYAQANDHRPSAQANLTGGMSPPWHGAGGGDDAHRHAGALSGIRTGEFGGRGYNQLQFDDSDRQGRVHLGTTQDTSELNLGHLIHHADNYRGSFRGTGFELRSDAWGAVRGQSGLLLTTWAAGENAPAGDASAPIALMRQHGQLAKTLSDAAKTHQTVAFAADQGTSKADQSHLSDTAAPLKAMLDSARTVVPATAWAKAQAAKGTVHTTPAKDHLPHSADALVTLAGRAGIGILAGQALHLTAGDSLDLASGQHANFISEGDTRLHSGQAIGILAGAHKAHGAGLNLTAAQGQLIAQAQHDKLKLRAKDQLKLVSVNAEVEFAGKKTIHMAVAGGASITIENGNITFSCPGKLTVHGGKKTFTDPAQLDMRPTAFPDTDFCLECFLKAAASGSGLVPA